MNDFLINLDSEVFESDGDLVVSGALKIGEVNESFHASLSYWDKGRYLSQWKYALKRLLNGEQRSAVVTTMYDPSKANFIFWWVMYLVGDSVYVQNHVLFLDELDRAFDETDLYGFIPERETRSEDGEMISEWMVALSAIKKCYELLES